MIYFYAKESKIWCCIICFEGFCEEHYKLHTQKIDSHDKFLIVHKEQRVEPDVLAGEEGEKQSKMLKLEIATEKAPQFDYFYGVEGENIEVSEQTVN